MCIELSCIYVCLHLQVLQRPALVPGFSIFSRGHAEISADLEAYGDELFLSPAGSILAQVGCYKLPARFLNYPNRLVRILGRAVYDMTQTDLAWNLIESDVMTILANT